MRMLSGHAAEARVKQSPERSSQLDEVEPAVRQHCRRRADATAIELCANMRASGMGSTRNNHCGSAKTKCRTAWKRRSPKFEAALKQAAAEYPPVLRMAETKRMDGGIERNFARATGSPAGFCRLLRSRRTISAGFDFADDGDSGAGRRSKKYSRGFATAQAGSFGGGGNAGSQRVLSRRRRAGNCRFGLRNTKRCRGSTKSSAREICSSTAAKKLVSFDCAIDMLAGPTEAVIVSDDGNPEFIAADLVAQAEHDPETLAVFITTSRSWREAVASTAT